jgi:tetratricopeptide (TPR) repeat protein
VAVALATRALPRQAFTYAETALRNIRTGRQEWAIVPALRAKSILGSEFHKNLTSDESSTYEQRRGRLREAEALLTQAIVFATREKQPRTAADAFLDRSFVRTLLILPGEAHSDVEEAYKLAPDDPSVMSAFAESKRMRGDLDGAILLIRKALQPAPRVDFQFQLAAALRARGKSGDNREAADLLMQLPANGPLPPTGRDHACMLAIDCLCRDERFEEAQRFLDSIPTGLLSPSSLHTIQARLYLSRNDVPKANAEADAALAANTPSTPRDELEYLASLLSDMGRHNDALPIWQKVVRPGEVGTDPKRLLNTAYRLQRHDIILDICDRLRMAGVYDEDLLQYEVHVLEQYDPDEAIRLLQERLTSHPDDLATQLHLSKIALRIGRNELVRADPSRMPSPATVTPFFGAVAVQILKTQGKPNEALLYAYELLRLNFLDPGAHRAYQFVLLPFGPMPSIEDHDTVQANSAVTILEDGTGEERTFVIEPILSDGHRFQDELPLTATLAQELIGKRAGDGVVLASGSLAPRNGRITKILNKYVSRYQDSISNWQIRFPDHPGIESVAIVKKPDESPDLSMVLASIDRRQQGAQRAKDIYYTKPVPIHMFAEQFGKNAFQGICMMAVDEGFTVDCAVGSREEVVDALQNLRIANEIVLEMTAIGTLALLNIESVLQNLGTQILVSQATVNELTEMIARDEMETGEGGYLSKQGDQPVYTRRDPKEHQNHIERLKALLSTIRSCARIIPGREAIALEPEKRKGLDSAFGRYGTEAILLASQPGRILWTDDNRMARFARTEHGVRRVWTQVLLQHALESGRINQEDFSRASAKLVGFEYGFTSVNPNTLVSGSRIAEWEHGRWPLRQAIAQFASDSVDLVVLLRLALFFIVELYREPIPVEKRDSIFTAILDSLALKPGAGAALESLEGKLVELFGLNAVGAQQANECLRRWLASRNFRV